MKMILGEGEVAFPVAGTFHKYKHMAKITTCILVIINKAWKEKTKCKYNLFFTSAVLI